MRLLLLAGASVLALSTPALAQEAEDPAGTEQFDATQDSDSPSDLDTPIDSRVGEEAAPSVPAPAPTGDPVLDRLNALESRIKQLEARNAELEQQAELNEGRLQSVETRAAKAAQF